MGNTSLRQQYHDVPLLHLGTSPHTPCVGACSSYAHSPAATSATSSPVVCSGVSRRGGISGGELQILYCLHCCAVCVWYEYLICNSTSYHLTYINITCITDLSNFFGISIVSEDWVMNWFAPLPHNMCIKFVLIIVVLSVGMLFPINHIET